MVLKGRREKMEMNELFIPGHKSFELLVTSILILSIAFDLLIEEKNFKKGISFSFKESVIKPSMVRKKTVGKER